MKREEFIRWSALGAFMLMAGPKLFSSRNYSIIRQATSVQIRHGVLYSKRQVKSFSNLPGRIDKTIFYANGTSKSPEDLINFDIDLFDGRSNLSVLKGQLWVNGTELRLPDAENQEKNIASDSSYHSFRLQKFEAGRHAIKTDTETVILSLSEQPFLVNNETVDADAFALLERNKKFNIQTQKENQLIFINKIRE